MIHLTITEAETDYLVSLLRTRPIGEALDLYGKVVRQATQANGGPLVGAQSPANGAAATEAPAAH